MAANTGKEAKIRQNSLAADARRTDRDRKEHRGYVEDALDLRIYETKEIGQDLRRMSNRVGEELAELRKVHSHVGAELERMSQARKVAEECLKRHALGDQDKAEVILKAAIAKLGDLIAEFKSYDAEVNVRCRALEEQKAVLDQDIGDKRTAMQVDAATLALRFSERPSTAR